MADLLVVVEGTLGDTEGTLYTAGANRALIVTEIRLTNKTATDRTAIIKVGTDTVIFPGRDIKANDGYLQSGVHTQILAGKTIKGEASAAAAIDYYFSGVEVSV